MQVSYLISDLFREEWLIDLRTVLAYWPNIKNVLEGKPFITEVIEKKPFRRLAGLSFSGANEIDSFNQVEEKDCIAIIEITGAMMRYGGFCSIGTEEIAAMLREAKASENIAAIVFALDTPGGTTSSIFPLKSELQNSNKPIIGAIKGVCASAGVYVTSYCPYLFATDEMNEVGSIGILSMISDDRKKQEMEGRQIKFVYPPESKYKNEAERLFLETGDTSLIVEELRPWAINFQNTMKQNRGSKLDLSVEGLLEGRMFYAMDAVANGLIDGIKTMDEIVEFALNMAQTQRNMKSIFN
jgi:protease IV